MGAPRTAPWGPEGRLSPPSAGEEEATTKSTGTPGNDGWVGGQTETVQGSSTAGKVFKVEIETVLKASFKESEEFIFAESSSLEESNSVKSSVVKIAGSEGKMTSTEGGKLDD